MNHSSVTLAGRRIVAVATLAAVLVVAACGGGSDGAAPGTSSSSIAGINGGGIARGAITGFGSIFVNGVEFSTSGATVRIEDNPASDTALKVGQVVVVRGSISDDGRTGTATSVTFNDDVEGAITAIDATAGTFVVLGQTVRVTATTAFDSGISPASLAGLAVGNVVEVSGLPDSTGKLVATRVERRAAAGELEVTGKVAGLDSTARRFTINTLGVDYSAATISNGTLANGVCVEAKGNTVTNNVLAATRIEVKSCTLGAAASDRGEIEGLVTRFASATDFDVGGQRVTTTATTTYVNGVVGDLRVDVKVEAEGTFNAAGTLEARKVEIKPESTSRLVGTVDTLNAASNSLTLAGVTVTLNNSTQMEDKSRARVSPLRFADLRTGDYLEVRGFAGPTPGTAIATRLERQDLDTNRELEGPITSVTRPNLVLLGVTVSTGSGTQYRIPGNSAATADQFFAAAAPNRLLRSRGTWTGTSLTAAEVEIKAP